MRTLSIFDLRPRYRIRHVARSACGARDLAAGRARNSSGRNDEYSSARSDHSGTRPLLQ